MWTCLLALFFSAGAHAQITRLVANPGGDPAYQCVTTPTCTDSSACTPFESMDICDPIGMYCIDRSYQEAICCDGKGGECPDIGPPMAMVSGRCTEIVNGFIENRGHVCVYPSVTFCQHDGDTWVYEDKVNECMTDHETGAPVSLWVNGDCDDDGCRNGLDRDPCNPDVGCPTGPMADAGPGMNVDAGGASDTDSGPAAGIDSGSRGGVPLDPSATQDIRFHGAGGCACRTTGGFASPGALGAALPLLAVWLLSRRRRSV